MKKNLLFSIILLHLFSTAYVSTAVFKYLVNFIIFYLIFFIFKNSCFFLILGEFWLRTLRIGIITECIFSYIWFRHPVNHLYSQDVERSQLNIISQVMN